MLIAIKNLDLKSVLLKMWNHFLKDSLFRNSAFIMMSTGVMSAFGFIFWIICARLYTATEIGLATSLISIASLLTTFSLFGLNNVIIKFFATSTNKSGLIITSLFSVSLSSIFVSSIFLIWSYINNSPLLEIGSIKIIVPIFILYVFLQATGTLLEGIFVANRDTKYILFKNSIFSIVKISLPFLFILFGAVGIIYSITTAALIAWISSLIFMCFVTDLKFTFPSLKSFSGMKRFASGNYFGNMFSLLPASLLPLIITSRLGAQEAAYFYMPLMITTLINVIPSANAQSLFAEASHNKQELSNYLIKAFKNLFILITPTVVLVILFGNIILSFFGSQYTGDGTKVLIILAISSFIGSLNYFGDTLLNIKKLPGLFVAMNAFNALIIVILAYITAPHGLMSVALSSLIGQTITLLVYIVINKKLIKEMIN